MIKRFNPPTHLDPMPYLSEWHHELEDGSIQIWVQCNEVVDDNTKPNWRRLGDIMEQVYIKYGVFAQNGRAFCIEDMKDWL